MGLYLTFEKVANMVVTIPFVFIYHIIGFFIGKGLTALFNFPLQIRKIVIACCMFGNYISLP